MSDLNKNVSDVIKLMSTVGIPSVSFFLTNLIPTSIVFSNISSIHAFVSSVIASGSCVFAHVVTYGIHPSSSGGT